jgi:hypothetical protein
MGIGVPVTLFPACAWTQLKKQTMSVALVGEQTIPTERPPLISEVSTNFCGQRGVV